MLGGRLIVSFSKTKEFVCESVYLSAYKLTLKWKVLSIAIRVDFMIEVVFDVISCLMPSWKGWNYLWNRYGYFHCALSIKYLKMYLKYPCAWQHAPGASWCKKWVWKTHHLLLTTFKTMTVKANACMVNVWHGQFWRISASRERNHL